MLCLYALILHTVCHEHKAQYQQMEHVNNNPIICCLGTVTKSNAEEACWFSRNSALESSSLKCRQDTG